MRRERLPSLWFFYCLVLFSSMAVSAQNRQPYSLKGKVTSADSKSALPGAFIHVRASSKGVLTDSAGNYRISVHGTDTIQITYVGYTGQRQLVRNRKTINIALKVKDASLDDVVVIGYGQVKRKDVTGSVGKVNVADLNKAPVPSFDQALAGRIAGVQVASDDGQPGSEINIVIRGGNSLTQSNSPLYVIDGFPIEDFTGAALNPEDIESISILKDASATAIYGARGANGVIIIETKKGKAGKPVVSYNGYAGLQNATKRMDMMSPYEFVRYQLELDPDEMTQRYLTDKSMTLDDYKNVKGINWQDMLFRKAFMQNHNLALRGGTSQTKYSISASLTDQDGVIINSGYSREQARISLDQIISKKLKASIDLNYSKDKNYGALTSSQASTSNSYATYLMYRVWGYRPISGTADIADDLFDDEIGGDDGTGSLLIMNPIISQKNEIRQQSRGYLQMDGALSYSILNNLTLNITGGYISRTRKNEAFYNSKTYKGHPTSVNLKGVNGNYDQVEVTDWVNENTLNYTKRIDKDNQLDLLAGFTMQGTNTSTYGFESTNVPNEELGLRAMELGLPSSVTSEASRNTLMSFLGRANYNFMSKYLFTASLRADGSSKFSKANRWGYFPSGAFAWQMGSENFMKGSRVINDAKLRISYGITGNNRVSDFARFSSLDLTDYYSFGNAIPGYAAVTDNLGNPDLKWEKTAQLDIGYDISFLKDRINLTIDAYRKTTSDLLLNSNLPYSTGFTKVNKNVGKIRNDGLEFSLSTVNIKTKSFTWESNFNISFNRNKIVALAENQTSILSIVPLTATFNSTPLYIARVGGPAAAFYGYQWAGNYQVEDFNKQADGSYVLKQSVPTNGSLASAIQPGDIKYTDQNSDGVVDEKDLVPIGRALPIHYGGFNNNFTYKQFSLNIFFQWSVGNDIMNANRILFEGSYSNRRNLNQFASYVNRWTLENPNNEYYRTGSSGTSGVYSSRTIEDGSFLRLKTVQLSYTFPQKWIGKISDLQIYTAGQNLYTWTSYSGMDPEVSTRPGILTPGFDYSAYARNLTLTFGLKASF